MERILKCFKSLIINAVRLLLIFIVLLSLLELVFVIFNKLILGGSFLFGFAVILELLGSCLLILIGLELLDTMSIYMKEELLSSDAVEVVLIVAITAACRKAIVIDYSDASPLMLLGISSLILALSISYYVLKKATLPKICRFPAEPL